MTEQNVEAHEEDVEYKVLVDSDDVHTIKVRIGDANSGDNQVGGSCPYKVIPTLDSPEWISELGTGKEITGKMLWISSFTICDNPHTDHVSVRVFINGVRIKPTTGEYKLKVGQGGKVYFNQKIKFYES